MRFVLAFFFIRRFKLGEHLRRFFAKNILQKDPKNTTTAVFALGRPPTALFLET